MCCVWPGCFDDDVGCPAWAADGQCQANSVSRQLATASCAGLLTRAIDVPGVHACTLSTQLQATNTWLCYE